MLSSAGEPVLPAVPECTLCFGEAGWHNGAGVGAWRSISPPISTGATPPTGRSASCRGYTAHTLAPSIGRNTRRVLTQTTAVPGPRLGGTRPRRNRPIGPGLLGGGC